MTALLLAVIYLAFISLGLPDSLLGAAWPTMRAALGVPISYAGVLSALISCGTIVSSLLSERLTRRWGAGAVTALSVLLTAGALFGFSVSDRFFLLCLFSIPFGLGAGAVDAALNNYVALHFSSRHMSWLHCCWGVGAALSPYIMGAALTSGAGWESGYRWVGLIQAALTALLFLSLPLWKKQNPPAARDDAAAHAALSPKALVHLRGVPSVLLLFFCYCALETTAGLWAASYLADGRGVGAGAAARFAALFYLGITAGRFLCGFAANRLGDRRMIRLGLAVLSGGLLLIVLPMGVRWLAPAGLLVTGFGCAPIYPAIIHATPDNFGEEHSQAVIGVQMACAYAGNVCMPPLFGLLAGWLGLGLYPLYLLALAALMLVFSARLFRAVDGAAG